MKKQQPKLMNLIFIIILYILTAAFFAYGLFNIKISIDYISSYQNSSFVTDQNIIQYIAGSSIIYFIAGLVTLTGAVILTTLNRLQKNIYEAVLQLNNNRISSSFDYDGFSSIDDGQQLEFQINEPRRRSRR